jgi:hypothetical protein
LGKGDKFFPAKSEAAGTAAAQDPKTPGDCQSMFAFDSGSRLSTFDSPPSGFGLQPWIKIVWTKFHDSHIFRLSASGKATI